MRDVCTFRGQVFEFMRIASSGCGRSGTEVVAKARRNVSISLLRYLGILEIREIEYETKERKRREET